MNSFANIYAGWRSKSHTHFKKLGGGENGRINPPKHFKGRIHDWIWLCENVYEDKDWQVSIHHFIHQPCLIVCHN